MKEIRNFWKDEKINELINQTSNDLDEDKQNVRDVISDLFFKVGKALSSENMPDVLLHRFGSFRVSIDTVNYYIRRLLLLYKEKKNKREYLKQELTRLFNKRNEYKKSSNSRKEVLSK